MAFFPLWPILLRVIAKFSPSVVAYRWVAIAMAGTFSAASIPAFHNLAQHFLAQRPARMATLLYALYPGASFLLLSYPTGLMNLLCILVLIAMLDGRWLAAGALSGLATAAGPLALGTALTVCLYCLFPGGQDRLDLGTAKPWSTRLLACCLALSGLTAFILWQVVALGDGLAFIHAQRGWAAPLPWPQRLGSFAWEMVVVPDLLSAFHHFRHVIADQTHTLAEANFQSGVNLCGLALALIGVGAFVWMGFGPVAVQALLTLSLYIWFDGATRPGHATMRLIYPAAAGFIGIAWLLRDRPRLFGCVALASGALLFTNVLLTCIGYHVV